MFPSGKINQKATIVKDNRSSDDPDLDAAAEELLGLKNLTLCMPISFSDSKSYFDFCLNWENKIESFLEKESLSDFVVSMHPFPVDDFNLIKSLYKKDDFELEEYTALVILLLDKNGNQLVKQVIEQKFQKYFQQSPIEELKEFNCDVMDYINNDDPNREILEATISKYFSKFFSEKRIYSGFHIRPLKVKVETDIENEKKILSIETTESIACSLQDWIVDIINKLNVTMKYSIPLDPSLSVLNDFDENFLQNYIEANFIPKEFSKPPHIISITDIKKNNSKLLVGLHLVTSGFHLQNEEISKSDPGKIVQEIRKNIEDFVACHLQESKYVDIIKEKFSTNVFEFPPSTIYLFGIASKVKEIQEFLTK